MIHLGDCIEVMRGMEAESVDAICTDPPYGIEFMGKTWDKPDGFDKRTHDNAGAVNGAYARLLDRGPSQYIAGHAFQAWCEEWGREALRVTKPGGYLLAFGGTRTHHRLVCGLEDAGWIIRDELDWIYACLSDDTELLTREHGWVRYNRANEGDHAAAFDQDTGELRWERIERVHQYDHAGPLAEVGPSLVTLNHRVILDAATARVPRLPRLWDEFPSSVGLGEADSGAVVLEAMQRQAEDSRSPVPTGTGVERGTTATATREDDGLRESGLEGRRYRVQEAWQLFGGSLRALSRMGAPNGPLGWVRDGASFTYGSYLRVLAHADRVRESREPRPDRQPPRESDALAGQPDPQAVRVGQGDRGNGLPTGDTPRLVDYAGVVWCITVPSGAFVARRNGVAFVTGNSGFPKGKANLKPAHEPIVLARKPGPLRPLAIDECRIGTDGGTTRSHNEAPVNEGGWRSGHEIMDIGGGRWPSNVLLSDPELFDSVNPYVVGSGATAGENWSQPTERTTSDSWYGRGTKQDRDIGYGDSGGYSRFFIIPKSDRRDREPVLKALYCTCETVKPQPWVSEDRSPSETTASTSPARAISEATSTGDSDSSTTLFGSSTSDPSNQDSRSTTSTGTSSTTESRTSSPSIPSPTSGSTPGASSSTGSGGSDAPSAPSTDRSTPSGGTSRRKAGRSTAAAVPATSPESSRTRRCADCGREVKPSNGGPVEAGDGVAGARRNSHPT